MRLRIGVAWEPGAASVSTWRRACVERLVAVPGVELALVIEAHRAGRAGGLARLSGRGSRLPRWRASVPEARWRAPGRIAGRIEGAGRGRLRLAAEDVARVREAGLDAIVHLMDAGRDAALAGAARWGVWSLHHGDGVRYSPGPVTAWEPHCAGSVLHVALIAARGEDAPPVALQQGCFGIGQAPWPRALESLLRSAEEWPAKVCREAGDFGESPLVRARVVPVGPAAPGSVALALCRRARRHRADLRRWLRNRGRAWREDQWTVGIVRAPIHSLLEGPVAPPVTWLPEASRHAYVADPFAVPSAEGVVILGERFDHRARRGEICALESLDGRHFGPPRPVLALSAHLSYPFVFESEGALYCIPEMFQSGGIHLFELVSYPGQWRFVSTLVEHVEGVDPTLLRHDGRLWLFCTTRADSRTALRIWWATALTGPWQPHRRNPVKYDVRSARPGGTPFEHGGRLFRPSQDCSETYGGAVRLNRILRLTPDDYDEETVAVVRPDSKGPYPAGIHTVSALGDRTLIDGKRVRWRLPWRPRGFAPADPEGLRRALNALRASAVSLAGQGRT